LSVTLVAKSTAYQLKIVLRDISPLIWRRVLVTSDTTIAALHDILQTVMGWEDLHLHRFLIYGKAYGVWRMGGVSFADDPHQVRLGGFRFRVGEKFCYEYDFGAWWRHDIRVERVLPLDPKQPYPVCLAGGGTCPPEDCGGPAGYRASLDATQSWEAFWQAEEDIALVAQRLLDFAQGGPRPTHEEVPLMEALERMQQRLQATPRPFDRRTVNQALRDLTKEP
jgi:hypothetical protein